MIERRFGMNRAENSGMELGLHACFDGIGDHQIGLARRKRVEDRRVVGPRDDRRFLKMSPVEAFIGASRIDDDAHAGLIDHSDSPVFRLVSAMRDRRLAARKDGVGEKPRLLAVEGDRDSPHCDVEAVRLQIGFERRPTRFNNFKPHAEGLRKARAHVDIEAFDLAGGVSERERFVVLGQADAKNAAAYDRVEARGGVRMGETNEGSHGQADVGGQSQLVYALVARSIGDASSRTATPLRSGDGGG